MANDEDRIMRYVENTWIDILSWGLATWHAYSSWTDQYDVEGSSIGGDKAIRLYSDDDAPSGLGIYLLDTFYPVVGTLRPSSDHAPVLLSPQPPQLEIKYTHPEPKLEVFTPDDVAAPDALAFRLQGLPNPTLGDGVIVRFRGRHTKAVGVMAWLDNISKSELELIAKRLGMR